MKKVVFIVLILILVLTCGVSVLAGETGNNQLLAEGILERYSGRGFVPELAYLPGHLIWRGFNFGLKDHSAGLMAEYPIQASELFGHHPKRPLKSWRTCLSLRRRTGRTHYMPRRAYYLDGQEKSIVYLDKIPYHLRKQRGGYDQLARTWQKRNKLSRQVSTRFFLLMNWC